MKTKTMSWATYFVVLVGLAALLFFGGSRLDWTHGDQLYLGSPGGERTSIDLGAVAPESTVGGPGARAYFAIGRALVGDSPSSFYWMNIILHSAVAFLLAAAMCRFGFRLSVSLIAGVLFLSGACHAITVLWVSGVSTILSVGWGLVFLRMLPGKAGTRTALLSLIPLAISLLCHDLGVLFGVAGITYLLVAGGRPRRGQVWIVAGATAALLILTHLDHQPSISPHGPEGPPRGAAFDSRSSEAGLGDHVALNYVRMMANLFAGSFLGEGWSRAAGRLGGTEGAPLILGSCLIIALALAAGRWKRVKWVFLWTLLTLLPFALLRGGAEAWRFHYIPFTGVAILIAMFLGRCIDTAGRFPAGRILGGIVVLLMLGGFVSAAATIGRGDSLARQHLNAGRFAMNHGSHERAIKQFEHAARIARGGRLQFKALVEQAAGRLAMGDGERAHRELLELSRSRWNDDDSAFEPLLASFMSVNRLTSSTKAPGRAHLDPEIRTALINALRESFGSNDLELAESYALLYRHYYPSDIDVRRALRDIYEKQGRLDLAAIATEDLARGLRLSGEALYEQGNIPGALAYFRDALQINPYDVRTHVVLGELFWDQQRWNLCVTEWETAAELAPDDEVVQIMVKTRLPEARKMRERARAAAGEAPPAQ